MTGFQFLEAVTSLISLSQEATRSGFL